MSYYPTFLVPIPVSSQHLKLWGSFGNVTRQPWDMAGFTHPATKTSGPFLDTWELLDGFCEYLLHDSQVMESLPARDSVQTWLIFVQYVKLNFKANSFSSASIYFVKSALPYGLTEKKQGPLCRTVISDHINKWKDGATSSHLSNILSFQLNIKATKH